MRYQPIYDIAELCFRKNIRHAVLCPGSRCAPLTLAFARHPGITTRTFSDERSAGFVALGMAQSLGSPVVIICTSGTALYNLAPAVAEAFFSHTPLIIITADRPSEWIAQHDGQTIYQKGIFGNHVKAGFELPQDYDHEDSLWGINRIVNDALNSSVDFPRGPVHINAPFREPLYPSKGEDMISYSDVRVIDIHTPVIQLSDDRIAKMRKEWTEFNNILLVVGQHVADPATQRAVTEFQKRHQVPVVHDIISNLHDAPDTVQHSDLFLGQASENLKEMLRPDLLITFGNSLVSKNLKIFLRKYRPKRHWHVQLPGPAADTFKNLSDIFYTTPTLFLETLTLHARQEPFEAQKQQNYFKLWEVEERRMSRGLDQFFADGQLTELSLVKSMMEQLPRDADLHLANSMSVRYANFIGLHASKDKGIRVFSNRGTSGIDGSTSTAVGHALVSGRPTFLITGDQAFFYDRNAFWHNYPLENLRILLLNNHGGLIFDILEGPSSVPEAGEYFITRQKLNARKLCEEFDFDYLRPDHPRKVRNVLKDFFAFENKMKLMELETDTSLNKQVLEKLKLKIKNSYEL